MRFVHFCSTIIFFTVAIAGHVHRMLEESGRVIVSSFFFFLMQGADAETWDTIQQGNRIWMWMWCRDLWPLSGLSAGKIQLVCTLPISSPRFCSHCDMTGQWRCGVFALTCFWHWSLTTKLPQSFSSSMDYAQSIVALGSALPSCTWDGARNLSFLAS